MQNQCTMPECNDLLTISGCRAYPADQECVISAVGQFQRQIKHTADHSILIVRGAVNLGNTFS